MLNLLLDEADPYSMGKDEKSRLLEHSLRDLHDFHLKNCPKYRYVQESFGSLEDKSSYGQAIPVRLFKSQSLKSIRDEDVFKVLTSSGTTSQQVSRIYLDKETSILQTKVLVKIMQSFLGKNRLPMLIIDCPSVISSRSSFSARGAGILGLSNFGRNHTYALNDSMELQLDVVEKFIDDHKGQPIFIFGFTYMVWRYFISALKNSGKKINLSHSVLVHSGGWKKMEADAVDNDHFKNIVKEITGIHRVHNFYGMVEQIGSIYVECEYGFLHAPNFADIEVVNSRTFQPEQFNTVGIVKTISVIPKSYPGHNLLTEDLGIIRGEDVCLCGRKGKFFNILGRVPKAEVRGCSDTHEKK